MLKHYAIKCTNCAAPLDILGAGRVNTVTCSYCHSILDMNDHYKVLAKFNDTKRPQGPFKIGMRGNIKGVEWTIVGWIAYRTAEFPAEEWSEFFLYSPTHGYAWLVYENSKVYFSKRVRDFDLLAWQEKKPKTLFYHKGHYLQKEASYLTYIDYVEGELNWVAKFGDKFTTWDYDGVGFQVLNIEKTGDEIEVYHTQRLKKPDIYHAFGLEYTQKSQTNTSMKKKDIHTLEKEEIKVEQIEKSKVKYGFLTLFSILLLLNILSFFIPNKIYDVSLPYSDYNNTFTVDSNFFISSIILKSRKLGKSDVSFQLYKEKKLIFSINRDKIFYTEKNLKNKWKFYTSEITSYLKLHKGTYQFFIQNKQLIPLHLTIEQNIIRLKYILPLLVLVFIVLLYFFINIMIKFIELAPLAIPMYFIYIFYNIFSIQFATFLTLVLFLLVYLNWGDNDAWDDDWDDDDD